MANLSMESSCSSHEPVRRALLILVHRLRQSLFVRPGIRSEILIQLMVWSVIPVREICSTHGEQESRMDRTPSDLMGQESELECKLFPTRLTELYRISSSSLDHFLPMFNHDGSNELTLLSYKT